METLREKIEQSHWNIAPKAEGSQVWVLESPMLPRHYLKIPKTPQETEAIARSWKVGDKLWLPESELQKWLKEVEDGKTRGPRVVAERLKSCPAILETKMVDMGIEYISESGEKKVYKGLTYLQPRIKPLKNVFEELSQEKKTIVGEKLFAKVIKGIQVIWTYGAGDLVFSVPINWGLTEDGRVVLFDIYQLTDNYNQIREYLTTADWGGTTGKWWEIMKKESQKSVMTFFGEETARRVLAYVEKELTVEKLDGLWNSKI